MTSTHARLGRFALALAILGGACGTPAPSVAPRSPAPATPIPATGSPAPASSSPSPALSPSASPSAAAVACADVSLPAGWWNDRVFYEIFVRSFADSDGDGIGDLRGLTAHLDQLNDGNPATTGDLGITGIWLMPVTRAGSYHGYDVTDYARIERDYGNAADFRAFMAAAHRRGIEVIVDLVLNHTSIDHPWFQASRDPASPKADWYRWSATDPGYGGPNGTPVWHPLDGRWYYGQFGAGMPDLNLENPEVTAALTEVARHWLVDLGVDGFRLDAIKHLVEEGTVQENTPSTMAWLAGFKERVEAIKPGSLLVGEVYDLALASARYVPDQVDMTFDFELATNVLQGVRNGEATSLAITQADALDRYAGRDYAAFLTNHDQPRVISELRGDTPSARVAASALLTGPGVPFIYYGEEIGLTGDKPDERIRAPMPWTGAKPGAGFTTGKPWEALEPGFEAVNVAAETADPASLLEHYRRLVALRAAHPALRHGAWLPLRADADGVYAFLTAGADETVAAILNLSDTPARGAHLALDDAATCPRPAATVAYADGFAAPVAVAAPAFGPGGSLDGWSPAAELPARSTLVVTLR